jgi:ABC-2 type transport system ATP-binding protein
MGNLLRRLHTETFVLNSRETIERAPVVPGFVLRHIDDHTLEADISKEQNLNELFVHLTTLGINVLSMRNKVNRLEEIFMRLVENRGNGA